ncbi:mannose-1-phosphate guanylyltransferase, partial [Bacillus cereus]
MEVLLCMKIVLLSGGAGKRLWPLSNTTRSKQFLKILESDYKDTESMVERVWRQISRVDMSNSVYIATSKLQSEILQNQLGNNIKTIIEPDRRDTFPAIALAASYLYSKEQIDIEEVITILPIDFYVQDEFFDKIKELDTAINDSDADIGLIGVNPTYPSEKYGYVIPTQFQVCQDYSFVKYFIEKPSRHHAQKLIKQNALWNCGVFAFKLKKILSILQKKGIPLNFDEFIPYFSELPKVSFDYEVLEKASNTIVLPYRGEWKDLGSW